MTPEGGNGYVTPIVPRVSVRAFLDMVVAADAAGPPIAFGRNLFLGEAARQKVMALSADVAGLADELGVSFSRRQLENLQPLQHEVARSARSAAFEPFDIDARLAGDWLTVRGVGDLDERPAVNMRRQSLENAEDAGNAGLVAGEQVPVGAGVEHDAAARSRRVDPRARLRVARPVAGGAVAMQHEVDVESLRRPVEVADRVMPPPGRSVGERHLQHQVLARPVIHLI